LRSIYHFKATGGGRGVFCLLFSVYWISGALGGAFGLRLRFTVLRCFRWGIWKNRRYRAEPGVELSWLWPEPGTGGGQAEPGVELSWLWPEPGTGGGGGVYWLWLCIMGLTCF